MKGLKLNSKRVLSMLIILALIMLTSSDLLLISFATDSTTYDVIVSGTYYQTEAREMWDRVNDGRGSKPQYTYDYTLEKIAMLRAAETAIYFDSSLNSTRPNGKSFDTAYSEISTSYDDANVAEFIMNGTKASTAEKAYDLWTGSDTTLRDSTDYQYIGIGCIYVDGIYYWAIEVSDTLGSNGNVSTDANDDDTDVNVSIGSSIVSKTTITAVERSYSLETGDEVDAPSIELSTINNVGKITFSPADYEWTIEDESIVTIEDGVMKAITPGTTTLTTSVLGSTVTVTVTVSIKSIESGTITVDPDPATYTKEAVEPGVTLTIDDKEIDSKYYTVEYENNVDIGTATVTLTGDGTYYTGTVSTTFEIECVHDYVEVVTPETCTTDGYSTFTCSICGDEYTVAGNSATGHNYVTTITKANATTKKNGSTVVTCSNDGCDYKKTTKIYYPKTVTLSSTSYTYNGSAKKPSVTVTDSNGSKISSSNYSVSYSNNTKVGTATVTITFKSSSTKYTGKLTKTFKINPKGTTIALLKPPSKGKVSVKINKQTTQTTGYQIRYSTSSKFTSYKTVTVSSNKTLNKTISGLTSKKRYYFQVRTYKTVNGVKYYSSWSASKSIPVK